MSGDGGGDRTAPKAQRNGITRLWKGRRTVGTTIPVIPAAPRCDRSSALYAVHIVGSVLLTLGLPVYRALADVCLSQLTS
jgi:hypothetical protein